MGPRRERRSARTLALAGAAVAGGALLQPACGARTGLAIVGDDGSGHGGADGGALDGAADGRRDARPARDASDSATTSMTRPLDCAEAGVTYIYVIGENNVLYSFYPATAEFTVVGTIDCDDPGGADPFSMAVDHAGVAYVVFGDGNLFRVSTKTASCASTAFVPGQHGIIRFGMGFVQNTNDAGVTGTSGETLYIASDASDVLARIDLTTFAVDVVGPFGQAAGDIAVTETELTGTGGGNLYGFFAPTAQRQAAPSYIIGIDRTTAKVTSTVKLPDVAEGQGWAFGFWGGDFYTFTSPPTEFGDQTTAVQRYRPSDGTITQVALAPVNVTIVGAGVSTCAPQE